MEHPNRRFLRIRGAALERLRQGEDRNATEPIAFDSIPGQMSLISAQERSIVALACIVLEQLRDAGGARVAESPLEELLQKIMRAFKEEERIALEIEAYEIFAWVGRELANLQEHHEVPQKPSPSHSHSDLIMWALHHGEDLVLSHYDPDRGELERDVITPMRIRAQGYLDAYCHTTRAERVFRLNRVAEISPIGGWERYWERNAPPPTQMEVPLSVYDEEQGGSVRHNTPQKEAADEDKTDQMSIFDES